MLHARTSGLLHNRQIMQMEAALACARIDYNCIQNQLAPISSLPDEVLSAVFEAGCVQSLSGHPECPPFEILVSQISQHWHNIALDTSRLWTNVVLIVWAPHRFEMADLYLHRSKVSALHLSIYIGREYSTLEDISALCNLIVPHVMRWRRVYIDCNWRLGFVHFLDCLPPVAPILQRIAFDRSWDDHDDGDEGDDESDIPQRIFLNSAPYLRGITLQTCLPPLTSITHLQLNDLFLFPSTSATSFCSMLTSLSALTHLVNNTGMGIPVGLAMGTGTGMRISTHPKPIPVTRTRHFGCVWCFPFSVVVCYQRSNFRSISCHRLDNKSKSFIITVFYM